MEDNRNVPPKVDQQTQRKQVQQVPDKPWWSWAGICFGAALLLMGLSSLVHVTTGSDLDPIVSGPGLILLFLALTFACAGIPSKRPTRGADGPATPSSKPYSTVAACLIACGASFIMAAMMIPAIHAAQEAAAKAENESQPWKEHSFADGKFSVKTPASWQRIEDSAVPVDIHLADLPNDLALVAAAIPKIDVAFSNGTEFAKQGVVGLQQEMDSVQAEELIESEVNGFPTVDSRVQATTEGTNLRFHLRYVDYGDAWLCLNVWSTLSKYAEHEETFARILDSIEIHR